MARIDLEEVCLTFRVRRQGKVSLKEYVVRRMFRKSLNPILEIHALDHVSLSLREGDRVGIIGHNGAGKSTLLRFLAGIYPPTSGKRIVEGRISSLFDVALGFQMEANGWENVALRGYLQGETPRTIRSKMQEIAEFTELGEFLDLPIRHYSAGMLVRLGFAISTSIDPEILLIDEVLAAGDQSFQVKAKARLDSVIGRARLLALVSHDLTTVSRLCNTVIWMDHGKVRAMGPAAQILPQYRNQNSQPQSAAA